MEKGNNLVTVTISGTPEAVAALYREMKPEGYCACPYEDEDNVAVEVEEAPDAAKKPESDFLGIVTHCARKPHNPFETK